MTRNLFFDLRPNDRRYYGQDQRGKNKNQRGAGGDVIKVFDQHLDADEYQDKGEAVVQMVEELHDIRNNKE